LLPDVAGTGTGAGDVGATIIAGGPIVPIVGVPPPQQLSTHTGCGGQYGMHSGVGCEPQPWNKRELPQPTPATLSAATKVRMASLFISRISGKERCAAAFST
jgi:hypothetical protein